MFHPQFKLSTIFVLFTALAAMLVAGKWLHDNWDDYHVAAFDCGKGRILEIRQESWRDQCNYLLYSIVDNGKVLVSKRHLTSVCSSDFSQDSFRIVLADEGDLLGLVWNPLPSDLHRRPDDNGYSWGENAVLDSLLLLYRFSSSEASIHVSGKPEPSLVKPFLTSNDPKVRALIRECIAAIRGFSDPRARDDDLRGIDEFTELRDVSLEARPITDQGLQYLSGLRHLQALRLSQTQITDASVPILKGFTELRLLWIHEVDLSPEAVAELKAAFPKAEILSGPYKLGLP